MTLVVASYLLFAYKNIVCLLSEISYPLKHGGGGYVKKRRNDFGKLRGLYIN